MVVKRGVESPKTVCNLELFSAQNVSEIYLHFAPYRYTWMKIVLAVGWDMYIIEQLREK